MMKRLFSAAFALVLIFALCVINVSAESYSLMPSEGDWQKTDCEGYSINVEYTDDATVFSADGYWPCADFTYAEPVTVNVNDYSLVYDFTVETGCTNINFTFTDGFGTTAVYSICNNTLGDVAYDSGSGDLMADEYKGVIKLTDLIASTMFLGGKVFPANVIVEDQLTFTAIQVYSVSSATVTVRELSLVPNDEIVEESEEESSEEPAESSTPAVESEDESTAESTAESTVESATESTEESQDVEPTEDDGLGVWLWVIIGAAVVVVVIVIVIIAKKKK